MDRQHLALGLGLLSALAWAANQLVIWWKSRPTASSIKQAGPPVSDSLGSDDPAPVGMDKFIIAILDACGKWTSSDFQLKVLQTPDITIAKALRMAREHVEKGEQVT
jgi:hypothetical protein